MLVPLLPYRNVIQDTFVSGKRSILSRIDYQTLCDLPNGFGGRIGILPRLPDGRYAINLSNRGLYGDFGGGVKAREYHLSALERELEEEAPQWKEGFLSLLPQSIMYALEEFYPYSYEKSKRTIRVQVVCLVEMPSEWLATFRPTPEVRELLITDLNFQSESFNSGLQLWKKLL
jgi:hypothetical protein